ncbi:MAG: hypothetical protein WKF84_02380 [Pyrinomonadaceae bacterium]
MRNLPKNRLSRRAVVALLIFVILSLRAAPAQTSTVKVEATTIGPSAKEQRAETVKPVIVNEEASTSFDALLGADSYNVYAEARMIGQQISSQSGAGEIIQMMEKLRLTPSELKPFISFVSTHAEGLSSSRFSIATMPASAELALPSVVAALDFPSNEEARKFEPQLRRFLQTLAMLVPPQSNPKTIRAPDGPQKAGKPRASSANTGYHVVQKANLLLIASSKLDVGVLKPEESLALSDEPRFAALRSRFANEQLFVYAATGTMERNMRVQMERISKEQQKRDAHLPETDAQPDEQAKTIDQNNRSIADPSPTAKATETETIVAVEEHPAEVDQDTEKLQRQVDAANPNGGELQVGGASAAGQFYNILPMMLFGGGLVSPAQPRWPEAIGVGLQLDGNEVALRILMVPGPSGTVSPIPMLSFIEPGPALAMEAPVYAPGDTELLIGGSIDMPRVFELMAPMMGFRSEMGSVTEGGGDGSGGANEFETQIAAIEKKYDYQVREQLLASLGSEVAASVPLSEFVTRGSGAASAKPQAEKQLGPIFFFSVKDESTLKKILPRVLESLGAKNADEQTLVEMDGDAELIVYRSCAVAFVNSFVICRHKCAGCAPGD